MSVIQPVNLIALSHILNRREVLQIPRDMQSAKQWMLQGYDVIDVIAGRAVEIDLLYGFIETGKSGADDASLAAGDIVSIPLRVSILPSALGLQVPLPVRRLPFLGAPVVSSSKLWIVLPHALLNGASSRFVFLAPFHSAHVSALAARTIAGLPVGDMPVNAWLASKELSEAARPRFGSGNNFLHDGMLSRADAPANDAFNFELEAA